MKRVKIFFSLARIVLQAWHRYQKVAKDSATIVEFGQMVDSLADRYFASPCESVKGLNFSEYFHSVFALVDMFYTKHVNIHEFCDSIEQLFTILGKNHIQIVSAVKVLVDSYIDFTLVNSDSSVSLDYYISSVSDLVESNLMSYDNFSQMCDHISRLFKIYRENNVEDI